MGDEGFASTQCFGEEFAATQCFGEDEASDEEDAPQLIRRREGCDAGITMLPSSDGGVLAIGRILDDTVPSLILTDEALAAAQPPKVSARQAEVHLLDGSFVLHLLSSATFTFVNEQHFIKPKEGPPPVVPVFHNDVLRFGGGLKASQRYDEFVFRLHAPMHPRPGLPGGPTAKVKDLGNAAAAGMGEDAALARECVGLQERKPLVSNEPVAAAEGEPRTIIAVLGLPPGGGKSSLFNALRSSGAAVASSDEERARGGSFDERLGQLLLRHAIVCYDKNVPNAAGLAKLLRVLGAFQRNNTALQLRVQLVVPSRLEHDTAWERIRARPVGDMALSVHSTPGGEVEAYRIFKEVFFLTHLLPTFHFLLPTSYFLLLTGLL